MEHYFIAPGAIDQSHVWVASKFLLDPPPGWMVDWSGAACENSGDERTGCLCILDAEAHYATCVRGTLVKSEDPQRVWKLTGTYNPCTDGYEAKWPD